MNKSNIVNVEEVMDIEHFRQEINGCDLEDIEIYENEKLIIIDERYYKEWRYLGLNNWDFITMKFWENDQWVK